MKLMLHGGALRRVDERFRGLKLPLELYVVDPDGTIGSTGLRWNRRGFGRRSFGPVSILFGRAVPAVLWRGDGKSRREVGADVQCRSRFADFREIVRKGVRLSNSSAQAVAMAEFVMGQVMAEWYPTAQYRAAQAAHEWRRIGFRELSQSNG